MTTEDQQEDTVQQQQQPEEASMGFAVSMGDEEYTLLFPELDSDEGVYVKARPTDVDEDEIMQKSMKIKYEFAQRTGAGGDREQMGASATISANAAFVAKCEVQIADFRLPAKLENGEDSFVAYTQSGSVAERDNREVYKRILRNTLLRDRIEGFLDFIGGRDTPAQQDFEELKNAHPQSLIVS